MKIAQLDEAALVQVRALEEELGTYVIALAPRYPLAELPQEKLRRLQELEKQLGVVLLAYEREQAPAHRNPR
jgi:tRNA U34 5-methylaminomethyl-2-thiouridine-forming methyltransferase MnmC